MSSRECLEGAWAAFTSEGVQLALPCSSSAGVGAGGGAGRGYGGYGGTSQYGPCSPAPAVLIATEIAFRQFLKTLGSGAASGLGLGLGQNLPTGPTITPPSNERLLSLVRWCNIMYKAFLHIPLPPPLAGRVPPSVSGPSLGGLGPYVDGDLSKAVVVAATCHPAAPAPAPTPAQGLSLSLCVQVADSTLCTLRLLLLQLGLFVAVERGRGDKERGQESLIIGKYSPRL